MAKLKPFTFGIQFKVITPVGVYYCTSHHGVGNEDDNRCDFAPNECEACDGAGVLGIEDYPERPVEDCPDCSGTGEPADCVLVQCWILQEEAG